jgi:hypothetical protein
VERVLKPELKIVASPALLSRGCVIVIGLEAIRDQAGSRWERMQTPIHAHLETLLRQKLGPADYYAQLDDLSFLVTMPSYTFDEAWVLCARVAHELHKYMFGHCDVGQLRIARAMRIDGHSLHCEPAHGADLVRLARRAGFQIAGPLQDSGQAPPPGLCPADDTASPVFTPIWDTQNEAVTGFRCTIPREQPLFGAIAPHKTFKSELASTTARLRSATEQLARDLTAGRKYLLSLPISYDLLGSPIARMEIAALCRGMSSAMRPYLQFEISDLPYGVPQFRLAELVASLRPFCRGVVADLPARIPSYAAYQSAGLSAIGLSLSAANVANTEMGSEIFKLATAARRLNLRSSVLDIPNLDMLLFTHRLKIHFLSGPMIGEPHRHRGSVMRLSLSEIVARTRCGFHAAERQKACV